MFRSTKGRTLAAAFACLAVGASTYAQKTTTRPVVVQRPVLQRPVLQRAIGTDHFNFPPPILETTFHNPPFNTTSPTWAKDRVGGKTFLSGLTGDAPFEWTQVFNPSEEVDLDFVGLSGWALSPSISDKDNPFLHPFGFDFEFLTAPDPAYQYLAAPTNDNEYVAAKALTLQRGHPVPNVLGMEVDQNLVPPFYRTQDGDRVALWGRWIVDTGHGDFHTEIHPPAMLVNARPMAGNTNDETEATIIGRPYLVGQTFEVDDYPMKAHLLNEVGKVQTFRSTSLEAHPHIKPKPFQGVHLMSFVVRPPSKRGKATDRLFATYKFTVRTGVAVQLVNSTDAVTVYVVMNDAQYKAPALPPKHSVNISRSDLKKLNSDAGKDYDEMIIAAVLLPGNPIAGILDSLGITTDRYDPLVPILGNATTMNVASLAGNTPGVVTNNVQPFPISGFIRLKWDRSGPTAIAR